MITDLAGRDLRLPFLVSALDAAILVDKAL
jgi:hypothetical protein